VSATQSIIIIAATIVGFSGLWLWLQRRLRVITQECSRLNTELKTLQKDQHLALQGSYGMGQRMLRLERRFKSLINTPQPEPVVEQPFSYTQATQMVEEGADEEAIAATCGISRSEAHLMRKLCAQGLAETPAEA
jgi:hypothetical protein